MSNPWTEEEETQLLAIIDSRTEPNGFAKASSTLGRGIIACRARYWLIKSRGPAAIAIIHCDYDEFSPSTYRGMTVKVGEYQTRFLSKEPEDDLANAIAYASERAELVFESSDVDNYFLDLDWRAADEKDLSPC